MTIENIEIIALVVSVAAFFWSLRYAVTRIIDAVDRLSAQMDRMGGHAAEEHKALMAAIEKLHAILDKTREDMDQDHQEMIQLIGKVREPLIALNAKLDAHVSDTRKP